MRVLALPPPVLAVHVTEMTEGAAPRRPGGGARPCTGHPWTCALAGAARLSLIPGYLELALRKAAGPGSPFVKAWWWWASTPGGGSTPVRGSNLGARASAVPWSQPGDLSSPASSAEGQHPAPRAATGRTPTQQTGQHAEALCNLPPAATPVAAEPPRPCQACLWNRVEPWREAPGTMDQSRLRLAFSRTLPLLQDTNATEGILV